MLVLTLVSTNFVLLSYHVPRLVPAIAKYYPTVSETEEEPEDDESNGNIEDVEVVEDNEASKEEEKNPFNLEALFAEHHKTLDDELTDTAESSPSNQHENDADRILFVGAAPGTSTAQLPKRPSGGFADEDELLFDS
jgi:hypothetical protein